MKDLTINVFGILIHERKVTYREPIGWGEPNFEFETVRPAIVGDVIADTGARWDGEDISCGKTAKSWFFKDVGLVVINGCEKKASEVNLK